MNKKELINAISERGGITKQHSERAVNAFIDIIADSMKRGEKVQITGFGSFEIKHRAAHTGRNPATGEEIEIPEKCTPVFKAGKLLKDAVS